jgi:hypothetical protein
MEPINNSAVNDGGELTGTRAEFVTGGHAESHMEVLLDSVDEVLPDGAGNGVDTITLGSRGDCVDDTIDIFLHEQVSNFSTGEEIIDEHKVVLRLDLSFSEEEHQAFILNTRFLEHSLEVDLEIVDTVGRGDNNTSSRELADERG